MKTILVAPALVLVFACHPGAPTPLRKDQVAQSAADCHYAFPDSSRIYAESETGDPARLIRPGNMRYPDEMKQMGIPGWVIVHYVIDINGRAVASSILVDSASDAAFIPPAMEMLTGALYRPAAVDGRPVPVCVKQKVNWEVS